jgi:single-stranded-DNA-specific exonuclease
MAAGLKVQSTNIDAFRETFCAHASGCLTPQMLIPELRLDCLAELVQMSEALVTDLQRLGPFGHGNRKPLLCCKDVEVAQEPRRVGKAGDHLQVHVRQGSRMLKCIAFNAGKLFEHLQPGTRVDLAVEPQINEYMGRRSVELEIKDLQFVR